MSGYADFLFCHAGILYPGGVHFGGGAAGVVLAAVHLPPRHSGKGARRPAGPLYTVLLAFFVVALVEEGTKFLFLRARTWRNPNFNYRFDGIVYAVFVSLGFAAFENIQYVLHYGLSVALPRALFAVPGHMAFAVFMGLFYGRAKLYEAWGDRRRCRWSLMRAYVTSVLLHGFYDACAMQGTGGAMAVFLVFVVFMFRSAFKHVKQESFTDEPV